MNYSGEDNLEVMQTAKCYHNYLLNMIQKKLSEKDKKILDFGAGTGEYARILQQKNPSFEVVALEPADNLNKYYKNEDVKRILSLSEEADFDFIYSLNVLEHIEDDATVLKALYEALKDGGTLCLYVPAFPCLYSAMDKKVGHYRRYTCEELVRKVTTAGFKIQKCQYKDFVGWFVSFVYKFLDNSDGKINVHALWIYDKFVMPVSIFLDKLTMGRVCGKNLWLEAEK